MIGFLFIKLKKVDRVFIIDLKQKTVIEKSAVE